VFVVVAAAVAAASLVDGTRSLCVPRQTTRAAWHRLWERSSRACIAGAWQARSSVFGRCRPWQ
jgi:hypothetical protein